MMSVDIKHKVLDVLSKLDSDVSTPSEKNALSTPYKSLERVRVDRGPLEDSGDHEMISEEKSITFKSSPSTDSLRRSLSKLNFFKNRRSKSLDEDEISSQRNRSISDPDGFVDSDDEYEETFSKDKKKNKRKSLKKEQLQDEKSKESWWNRWANHIKYSIISKETEEAFLQIVVLLKLFLKDVEIKPLDITMCLALMSTYHTSMTGAVRTELMVTDVALAQKMHRYMKFACAAYGWKLINGYKFAKQIKGVLEGIKLKDEANSRVLLTHTNILVEDIVSVNWSSGHFHPGHFIAIDHSTKAVVVSIRGTFHVKDCLTDLIAHYEKFMGGYAHTGILMAARRKYKDLTPTILENMKKYPDYKLILVGHSLGAGTASLLAMMLYNDYNLPLHCYAYAPPCVVSLDLAKRCQSFITSVVVNDDIVPRLSWGSMEDLRKIIVHLLNQKENNLQRFFQFLSAGNNLGESLTSRLSTYFKCQPTPDLGTTKMELSTRLYPPGTVYHLFKESKILSPKYNLMEESSPSLFGDIIISPCMFTDHMPDTYEDCLGLVVDRLVQEQQKQQ